MYALDIHTRRRRSKAKSLVPLQPLMRPCYTQCANKPITVLTWFAQIMVSILWCVTWGKYNIYLISTYLSVHFLFWQTFFVVNRLFNNPPLRSSLFIIRQYFFRSTRVYFINRQLKNRNPIWLKTFTTIECMRRVQIKCLVGCMGNKYFINCWNFMHGL